MHVLNRNGTTISVIFTMDCEAESKASPEGGPDTYQEGADSISGFNRILRDFDLPSTLFIVPRFALRMAGCLREEARFGTELGLHIHPQNYGIPKYLGQMTKTELDGIFWTALKDYKTGIGRGPLSFRGGNFSANSAMYETLAQHKLQCGSLSCPGRKHHRFYADWTGSNPYPHVIETRHGDFFDIPVSSDYDGPPIIAATPLNLRVEFLRNVDVGPLITRLLREQINHNRYPPVLCVMTHNFFDYQDKNGTYAGVLRGLIKTIYKVTEELRFTVRGDTIQSYYQRAISPA